MLLPVAGMLKAQSNLPADKNADPKTIALYHNLQKLRQKGIMFGHQDDLAYGVGWQYENGRSDVKDVTGDYPAVYGWELGRIEIDQPQNLDGVPFDLMKKFIREGYERGGVITISWHLNNPLTGKSAWDPAPGTVASVLPGAAKNELYKSWLDKVADFMLSLKDKNGDPIPVIFRPFHELNGSWFWWGKNHCPADELMQLYRFTETYLRDVKNVHNLLYAFNTDRFSSEAEYLERYPGDEYVDVIGFDIYQRGTDNAKFIDETGKSLTTLEKIATGKNKIPALTEFGYSGLPDPTWWTNVLLKAVQPHHISYMLAWRNAGKKTDGSEEFYIPYKGQASAGDFILFYKSKRTLFESDIAKEKLYR
ncbi:MAG TPA: glycosyl hydrolase [Panacibacter sp.]|nr:glycosyl hydrolase [Panacibacter sp.]HNP43056.1 glycosyl hydrolase [Panacibacter sp.]